MNNLKLVIALLWAICITVIAIYLLANKTLGKGSAAVLFAVAIIGGFVIANYDFIKRIEARGKNWALEVETVVGKVRTDANEISEIKERIENQAATIDLVASRATEALELSQDASEKNKLAEIELTKIQATSAFQSVILSATNDDRKAYDQLLAWRKDSQFQFQQLAAAAMLDIRTQFAERVMFGGLASIAHTWKEGVDPNTLTISQLVDDYNKIAWHLHSGITAYIWERDDFPKKDRIQFLVNVLKDDRSLKAVCLAGKFLSKEANIKFNPLVIEPLLEWWDGIKDK